MGFFIVLPARLIGYHSDKLIPFASKGAFFIGVIKCLDTATVLVFHLKSVKYVEENINHTLLSMLKVPGHALVNVIMCYVRLTRNSTKNFIRRQLIISPKTLQAKTTQITKERDR